MGGRQQHLYTHLTTQWLVRFSEGMRCIRNRLSHPEGHRAAAGHLLSLAISDAGPLEMVVEVLAAL